MTAGRLMLDLEGIAVTAAERKLLLHPQVGGVIFFSRNFATRTQFLALTATVRTLRPELLLAVDQEGGRVQRLLEDYTRLPSMQALGDLLATNPQTGAQLLRDTGWLLAAEVIASGLDFSFAPVLDVDRDHCAVIAARSFGGDPAHVIAAAGHFISGLHEAGMAVTGKHFPGHGGVHGDSHLETPIDPRCLAAIAAHDLKPFQALAGELDGVMSAHIRFPAIDPEVVSFSPFWLQQVLRTELGFNGIVFSDDLAMKGADVLPDYAAKAAAALTAGCDMLLVCNDRQGALQVLEFLAANPNIGSCPQLATMRARRDWTWQALTTDPRRRATVDALTAACLA